MEKVAFVMSREKSDWVSCQSISKNLLKAYQLAFKNAKIKIFDYSFVLRDDQISILATDIVSYCPDKVVYLDHYPHMKKLHLAMERNDLGPHRPSLFIHVYGDFTLYLKEWLKLSPFLKLYKMRFVCASDKQVSLIKKFFKASSYCVSKCPFPIDEKTFFYDPQIRDSIRRGLKLQENQKAFLYTGRVSYQKNILSLVNDFAEFLKKTNCDARLFLAGKFDDIGKTFLDYHFFNQEFFYLYHQTLKKIPNSYRKNIIFLGNLSQEDLREVYNACDFYVNLSVHNDEDYGMAPAEALCCGLPCILTDWGGFSSFAPIGPKRSCQLIPVHILEETISYERKIFIKMILKKMIEKWAENERFEVSKLFLNQLSIPKIQSRIKAIHALALENFKGFSPLMEELVITSTYRHSGLPFHEKSTKYTEIYKGLYESYES